MRGDYSWANPTSHYCRGVSLLSLGDGTAALVKTTVTPILPVCPFILATLIFDRLQDLAMVIWWYICGPRGNY